MNDYAKNVAELTLAGLEKRTPVFTPDFDAKRVVEEAADQHLSILWLSTLSATNILSDEDKMLANRIVLNRISLAIMQDKVYKIINNAFEEKGIRNMPVKGICLREIYESKQIREMGDLDILVYPEDIEKAREVMAELGYHLLKDDDNHEIVFLASRRVNIEIHKSLYEEKADEKQYAYFCDRSKDRLKQGAKYTYEYGIDDFYIYIMSHMARHFYEQGCGVRGLIDIYVYKKHYGQQMNRQYLEKEFEKLGILTFVNQMERMTDIWLGGEKSSELYDNLIDYMLEYGAYGEEKNGIWNKFSRDNHEVNNMRRLKLKYYFPSVDYLKEYYPILEKRPYHLPAIWIKRAINGMAKKGSNQRMKLVANVDEDMVRKMAQIYDSMDLDFTR